MTQETGKVRIRGRQYKTVGLRVLEFREQYPAADGWAIITEIVERTDEVVVVRASIIRGADRLATGLAEERRTPSGVNKTSALENAETSAIGRALSAFGFGSHEYASADEVANAIRQDTPQPGTQSPAVALRPPPAAAVRMSGAINEASDSDPADSVQRDRIIEFAKRLGMDAADVKRIVQRRQHPNGRIKQTLAELTRREAAELTVRLEAEIGKAEFPS